MSIAVRVGGTESWLDRECSRGQIRVDRSDADEEAGIVYSCPKVNRAMERVKECDWNGGSWVE